MVTKIIIKKNEGEPETHTVGLGNFQLKDLMSLTDGIDSTSIGHFSDYSLRVSGKNLHHTSNGAIILEQAGQRVRFTPSEKLIDPDFSSIVVRRLTNKK